ncbi:MAG: hypothetical protein NDI69_12990 [Bacteriovoracaceae bacterium]|nr:hypothetical protein [Bacteriovoracaceae bacterium]
MKRVLLFLLVAVGCAQQPIKPPVQNVATDSIAQGKVSAIVTKKTQKRQICFDITLKMQGVKQQYVEASNWNLAWTDAENRFHLLNLKQRQPASVPRGGKKEWTNTFWTCDAKSRLKEIDSLLLTPKTLPFRESEGLKFQWK